ncbi:MULTISPECIES: helix-turn-helix domain-containing protein [Actinomadura]|uniref:Helix-turn-helix transcriptional regulator n=1 Tax=Actinomadura yumaensis TaxID=111807 RepID=A0ABW2CUM1_9ACTN|nr:helix-turn-helix transcriptional regulator [Actinomadura sp. J1-007]
MRRQRMEHGLSANQLAIRLECDRSTVSRVENGLRRLSADYAAKLDEMWNLGRLFSRLVRFANATDEGDWFTGLTEHEAVATHHRMWEALLVPGLLQTEGYARAALNAGLVDDVERALKTRMARQAAVFGKPKIPHVSVLINWAVLAQPIGPPAIMVEQLAHLIEIGELPNVSVRVLEREAGANVGLDGSFALLTVDDRDIAFADAPERGRLMLDPPDVQRFGVRYDRISNVAAPVGPSRRLLEKAMESYK